MHQSSFSLRHFVKQLVVYVPQADKPKIETFLLVFCVWKSLGVSTNSFIWSELWRLGRWGCWWFWWCLWVCLAGHLLLITSTRGRKQFFLNQQHHHRWSILFSLQLCFHFMGMFTLWGMCRKFTSSLHFLGKFHDLHVIFPCVKSYTAVYMVVLSSQLTLSLKILIFVYV